MSQGVSLFSMVCIAISIVVSVGLPFVLFFLFRKRFKLKAVPILLGMIGFVVFALLLEPLLHRAVLQPGGMVMSTPVLYMLYGGLAAGVFEETARFILLHILKRGYRGVGTGFAYGIGHGGVESIILAGIPLINTFLIALSVNAGTISSLEGTLSGTELTTFQAQVAALTQTSAPVFLLSGGERILAVAIQIALSVIVWNGVNRRGCWWLFPVAIVLHAIADFPAALAQTGAVAIGLPVVEGLTLIWAVIVVLLAVIVTRHLKHTDERPIGGYRG